MKFNALILLSAAALASARSRSSHPNGCPTDWTVEKLTPHNDCHKFYQCWDGKLVVHTCPSKLYFSVEENRCEWAQEVDCSGRDVPEDNNAGNGSDETSTGGGNSDPSLAPKICATEGSGGVLVAHEKCNKYYICDDGKPVALLCPGNLLFNPQTDQCDWPVNVKCGDREIPSTEDDSNSNNDSGDNGNDSSDNGPSCNCNPGEAPNICSAGNSDSILVAHESCNKYYICCNGKPLVKSCPAILLYNPLKEICDWPENVNCGDRGVPGSNSSGEGSNENGGNGDGENGQSESSTENNGSCGGGNDNPALAPEICAAEDSENVLVAHEKCNQFYVCNGGKPVALRCPGNLLFNPQTDQCDWPENVNCGDRQVPDTEGSGSTNSSEDNGNGDNNNGTCNCDPGQAPTVCSAEGSDSVLVAHESCNKYYICCNGKPLVQSCPTNLLYNPHKEICDWPVNVSCGDRGVPGSNSSGEGSNENGGNGDGENGQSESSTESNGSCGGGNDNPALAPEICAAEDSENVLVAHEKCNQFYVCNGGKPVALRCPGNLLFNPQTDQCDWPENVNCGDRQVPDTEGSGSTNSSEDNGNGDNNNGTCNCDPGQAPTVCSAEGSDSVLVAHESCNKYYICCNGKPLVQSCPTNLLYNPHKEICDWPVNVSCGDRGVPGSNSSGEGSNENGGNGDGENGQSESSTESNGSCGGGNDNPALAPEICAAEGSENVLVAHEKCNKFYVCNRGKPVALRCPGKLLFNPQTDQCDWPENVNCGDRQVPDTEGSGSTNSSEDNGNGDNNNGTCNCDPGQAPSVCSAEGSDSVLVAHESCNKYYICSDGKPLVQSCPAKLLYNPHKEICDWPENVSCGDRIVPSGNSSSEGSNENGDNGDGENGQSESSTESNGSCGGGNDNPALAPEICAAEGSENVLVAHEKCNQFYVCNGGKPVALRCPGNLLFNPQTDQCDWPENVNCGDRQVPDTEGSGSTNSSEDNGNGDNNNGTCNCDPGQAPSVCSAEGSDSVLVAHESCNKYYICSDGKPLVQSCPAKLLYNPHKEICDWPENVNCGDRVVPSGNSSSEGSNENGGNGDGENGQSESSTESNGSCGGGNDNPALAPEICAAEGSENVLVAHEKCNKFYVCNGGKPVALRCPGNLLFNPQTDQCDWPENVNCGDRQVPDTEGSGSTNSSEDNGNGDNNNGTCNCDPGQAPSVCSAEGSDSVLVAHESCNKYYICSDGKPLVQSCPAKLLYNPHKEICDWPENVSCGDRVVPGSNSSSEGSNENGGNGDGENGQSESSTESNGNGGGGNDNPALAPEICAAEDSENVLVAHEKCNKFYVCNGGKPVALRCPGNLLFNPQTDQCDWPENVNCGDRQVPDAEGGGSENSSEGNGNGDNNNGTCNCDPGQAPSVCSAEGSDSVLVAHESCNKYYICSDGKPHVQSCPAKLLYNPHKEICDWPENVSCGDRVVPGSNSSSEGSNENGGNGDGENGQSDSSTESNGSGGGGNDNPALAPEICAAEGSENVLVAHEKCNKFYVCNGGKPVALRCPGNLLFNPQTDQCDWPENVNCGDRQVPDAEGGGSENSSEGNGNGDNNNGTCNCDPGQAPSVCSAEGSDSVLVAHESCNKYYICSDGKPHVQSCPAKLLYNPHKEICDWPENVSCGDRVVPGSNSSSEGSNENGGNGDGENGQSESSTESNGSCGGGNDNPAVAPEICAAEDSENVLIAHEKCNQFYVCNGGKPVALRCPGNLLFNPRTDQCDWPENVNCGDRQVPDAEGGGSENSSEGNGNGDNNNGTCNCDPGQAPSVCSAEGSDSVLVAHESCNKYYICSDGKPLVQSCPAKLLYNPHKEICDWPENVSCGDRVVPGSNSSSEGSNENGGNGDGENGQSESSTESNGSGGGGNDNPALAPEICAAEGSENVLVAHEKCNQFYVCNGGKPVALRCPGNLLFNPQTDQCDWPENVNCGDRQVPNTEGGGSENSSEDNGNGHNNGTCNCDPGQAPSVCSATGSDNVLVAHESCNKYYICCNGKPLVQSCPTNLLYNPHKEICDWPKNVTCGDRGVPSSNSSGEGSNENGGNGDGGNGQSGSSESESATESNGNCGGGNDNPALAPEICAAEDSEGVLVAHQKCNQFFVCNGGKPVVLRCPVNLLFNPQTDQCDWPQNVNCGDREIPNTENGGNDNGDNENGSTGTCNCNPEKAPEICASDNSDNVLVAHESCNRYYICANGQPLAQECPGELLYNPHKEVCDWPENVNCEGRDNNGDCNNNDVDNDSSTESSNITGKCQIPSGGSGNTDPSQAPTICASKNSTGILIAHENCNQFYKCDHGLPVVFKCPETLLFNPSNDKCDWSHCVECSQRNKTTKLVSRKNNNSGNSDPSQATKICAGENSDGILIAHEQCNKFYKCLEGTPVTLSCPGNLLYVPEQELCDWPENVDCNGRNTGDNESESEEDDESSSNGDSGAHGGNDDPSLAGEICAAENSDGILVAHENCNEFYMCSEGLPVAISCPLNLLFQPSTNQCDWPENVDCGDRILPTFSVNKHKLADYL